MTTQSRAKWNLLLAIPALIVSYRRLYYAADITDESQYVAQAYMLLVGGTAFKTDLLMQQSAGFVIFPILGIYTSIFSTEGLVLFIRHLYWLAVVVQAMFVLRFLRQYYGEIWYLPIIASLSVAFIPFSIPGWSYNTVAYWGFPVAVVLLFDAKRERRLLAVLGGLTAALTCFSYLPMAAPLGIAGLGAISQFSQISDRSRSYLRNYAASMFAALGAAGSWVLIVHRHDLAKCMELTTMVSAGFGTGWLKLVIVLQQIVFGLPLQNYLFLIAVVMTVIADGFDRMKPLGLLVVLWLLYNLQENKLYPTLEHHGWVLYACIDLLILDSLLVIQKLVPPHPRAIASVICASICAGLTFGFASGNGAVNCSLGMMLLLQLLLLRFSQYASGSFAMFPRALHPLGVAIILFGVVGYLAQSSFFYVYRDRPISSLNHRIESGPFKYIYSTADRARGIEELGSDLQEHQSHNRTIFAAYMPAAYFMSNLKPLTGMLYLHAIPWPESSYRLILGPIIEDTELPDLVVIGSDASYSVNQQFDRYFMETEKYTLLVTNPFFNILKKIRD